MDSPAGLELWFLHQQGYRFTDSLQDLTVLQKLFIGKSLERDYREQNKQMQMSGGSGHGGSRKSNIAALRSQLKADMRERERGAK
ncbi:MAG TPA: hypothetical protein PLI71_09350 [Clostridia bacterium]|nr:hypothetical protein [Clostridia bacterium]